MGVLLFSCYYLRGAFHQRRSVSCILFGFSFGLCFVFLWFSVLVLALITFLVVVFVPVIFLVHSWSL